MVDLPSLVQAAHGGEVVGNLAQQFGLSSEQTKAAIDSLTSAIAQGVHNHIQSDETRGQVIEALNDPTHQQAYADPAAAQTPQASEAGQNLLNQLFGAQGLGQIVSHVSTETGIDATTLSALASTVASVVAGGVAKVLAESGFGSAAQVGVAPVEPEVDAEEPKPEVSNTQKVKGVGPGAAVGSIVNPLFNALFGALFKGKIAPARTPSPGPVAAPAPEPAAASVGADLQTGLTALGDLLKSSQASEALQGVLGQIFAKR
ncbi:putative phage tail protein [Rhodoblastus sphagnicola]|nr:DUF937 domain-containing protein [Rhodoblastus sphagnicola]MBB4199681.1 putative phage tail protein [Rhodoblastus sphagnicola]